MEYQKVILIPAYTPDEKLISLLKMLTEHGTVNIVVNDGSGHDYDALFKKAEVYAVVLRHEENRGKGTALKTGLQYIEKFVKPPYIIVTADADGQHAVSDIIRAASVAEREPDSLVLGSRKIEKNAPFRSRFGNGLTRAVFRISTGTAIYDTQTGLRAFCDKYVSFMKDIPGERYEYEMNVLLCWARAKRSVREIWIKTIYIDGNTSSHFHVIRDSILIYGEILKYTGASLISFVADYILFNLIYMILSGFSVSLALDLANVIARLLSAGLNYTLNRKFVFKSNVSVKRSALQYGLLAAGILVLNTIVLEIYTFIGIPPKIAKVMTECTLFMISLLVQKKFIFKKVQHQPKSNAAIKEQTGGNNEKTSGRTYKWDSYSESDNIYTSGYFRVDRHISD